MLNLVAPAVLDVLIAFVEAQGVEVPGRAEVSEFVAALSERKGLADCAVDGSITMDELCNVLLAHFQSEYVRDYETPLVGVDQSLSELKALLQAQLNTSA